MFRPRKKKSGWSYNTSAGHSLSVLVGMAENGDFVLDRPGGGSTRFHYASLGASASVGAPAGVSRTTEDSYSVGDVLVSQTFRGSELSVDDFEGFSLIQEISAGAVLGGSGTLLLLGIPLAELGDEITKELGIVGTVGRLADLSPDWVLGPLGIGIKRSLRNNGALARLFLSKAKAALLIAGFNSGIQLSAGVSASIGYVWSGTFDVFGDVNNPDTHDPVIPGRRSSEKEDSIITLSGDVLFDFDKWYVKPEAEVPLMQAVSRIRTKSPRRVQIVGHTDSKGGYQHNVWLSLQRANAVKKWLHSRNIGKFDISVEGKGASQPIALNKLPNGRDNPAGRARNRRVVMYLLR